MTRIHVAILLCIAAGFALPLSGQNAITVAFSDPSRAGTIEAQVLDGDVTVRGYDGVEVIIVMDGNDLAGTESVVPERAQGLRRILSGSAVSVEESDNVIRINSGWDGDSDLDIQVPFNTSIILEIVDGDIDISDISGEIELSATDGDVMLNNISGPVVAHAVDGDIIATIAALPVDSPTSLSSVDGDIDFTLPSDAQATVTMRSFEGEIYTDFDVDFSASGPTLEGARETSRRRGFVPERTRFGTINGGGIDVGLQTMDGTIYLRRSN